MPRTNHRGNYVLNRTRPRKCVHFEDCIKLANRSTLLYECFCMYIHSAGNLFRHPGYFS